MSPIASFPIGSLIYRSPDIRGGEEIEADLAQQEADAKSMRREWLESQMNQELC